MNRGLHVLDGAGGYVRRIGHDDVDAPIEPGEGRRRRGVGAHDLGPARHESPAIVGCEPGRGVVELDGDHTRVWNLGGDNGARAGAQVDDDVFASPIGTADIATVAGSISALALSDDRPPAEITAESLDLGRRGPGRRGPTSRGPGRLYRRPARTSALARHRLSPAHRVRRATSS